MQISVRAYAKVNLFLEVLYKRTDGYHAIDSIFHTISLHDVVTIEERNDEKIVIESDIAGITDCPEKNSAFKAAMLCKNTFSILPGFTIYLKKDIPIGGGLGGSSADAAGVFRAITSLYKKEIDQEFLKETAKVGADVPFLILQGCALVGGIGEEITPLPYVFDMPMVVAFPGFGVDTKWAYSALTFLLTEHKIPSNMLLRSLEKGDNGDICAGLYNRFEHVVFDKHPQIRVLKERLLKSGARAALMSGSGSSVFGVYDTTDQAYRGAEIMRRHCDWVRVVTPTGKEGTP